MTILYRTCAPRPPLDSQLGVQHAVWVSVHNGELQFVADSDNHRVQVLAINTGISRSTCHGVFTRSCCSGMGESATTLEAVLREPAEERKRNADKGKNNRLELESGR